MRKRLVLIWALVILLFLIAIFSYSSMPERIASHWDYKGQVDGYSSKLSGVFALPLITLIVVLVLLGLPLIFPLKENIEKIRKYYDNFIILFIVFLLVVYSSTILWNLGYKVDILYILPIALAVLFFYIGIVLEKSKRNWIIGIRTPWTLSSDYVWDKTHALGGKLFKICALLSLIGIFFKNYSFLFILVPIIAASLYLLVYSYLKYREEQQKGKKKRR